MTDLEDSTEQDDADETDDGPMPMAYANYGPAPAQATPAQLARAVRVLSPIRRPIHLAAVPPVVTHLPTTSAPWWRRIFTPAPARPVPIAYHNVARHPQAVAHPSGIHIAVKHGTHPVAHPAPKPVPKPVPKKAPVDPNNPYANLPPHFRL
jgi:hypothetical protein